MARIDDLESRENSASEPSDISFMAGFIEDFTYDCPPTNVTSSEMSPSTSKPCPSLPPELWYIIFTDAIASLTFTPHRRRDFPSEVEKLLQQRLIAAIHRLVLVCKLWHAIAVPLLYETVHLKSPDVARRFLRTLVESASAGPQAGYGQCVHHLVLPLLKKSEAWEGFHIIDVLGRCPNLKTLWKPHYWKYFNPPFWHGFSCPPSCTGCPPQPPYVQPQVLYGRPRTPPVRLVPDVRHALVSMTALQHIHWNFSPPLGEVAAEEKRLSKLLSYTPNLISLSLACSREPRRPVSIHPTNPLTSLTKVEFCENMTKPVFIENDMPNFTHIVTVANALGSQSPRSISSMFGEQLTIIELLDDCYCWSLFREPFVTILYSCPKLDTLKYGIDYWGEGVDGLTLSSQANTILHKSLRNVILRIDPTEWDDEALFEQCLVQHASVLTGTAFPAFRRVVLEGIVDCDAPFQQAYAVMCHRFPVQRIDGKDVVWEC